MNIDIKTTYKVDLSGRDLTLIVKALKKFGTHDSTELAKEFLNKREASLKRVFETFIEAKVIRSEQNEKN